jgi:hypothetical protein
MATWSSRRYARPLLLPIEVSELAQVLETVPSQDVFVSQIERLCISCSLRLLQNQMKAEAIYSLGEVLTLGSDYYLAFST